MRDMVNHITVMETANSQGYYNNHFFIDKKSLPQYLKEWISKSSDEHIKFIGRFFDLYPAWNKDVSEKEDRKFVWELIEKTASVLPLLLGMNYSSFSGIIIVADVIKTNDFVYWNKIGYVFHDNKMFVEERKEDVYWIKEIDWKFTREEYENMVNEFWAIQTLKQLRTFPSKNVVNVTHCAGMLADLTRDGIKILDKHIEEYGEVSLHILASQLVVEPLIHLSKRHPNGNRAMDSYCRMIEIMKKQGTKEVANVVDVTIWEGLLGEINTGSKAYAFMAKLMESKVQKAKKFLKKCLLFFLICGLLGHFAKRTLPIGRTDFDSIEHFEKMGGECWKFGLPDGAQDVKYYLTFAVLYGHSLYSFSIEDEEKYDEFMEFIKSEAISKNYAGTPGWDWYRDGRENCSEEEYNERIYLAQNCAFMDYKEILERASKHKYGFENAYGADVEDFIDLEYELDNFPIGLPYEKVISDDIKDYTLLIYYPSGCGSVTEGIAVNEETHRFVVFYGGTIK